ncbi:hypothetical protein [Methanocalculus sp.]|uniref:hypothetical protein n=1 Tax=Methanocalculus sp. TaxID=2004547 RepID=UPI0027284FEE|nr:hypothetical protein [Methanocalculus sp.]MDO8842124.1 hypothetical protein [Methanocalculus sp.]
MRYHLLIVACLLTLLTAGCIGSPDSYQSSYSYDLTISFTEVIHNATFLFPYPSPGFDPILSDLYGLPDGWQAEIVTIDGDRFLSITASVMVPSYHGMPIAIEPGESPLPAPPSFSSHYSEETPVLMPENLVIRYDPGQTIETKNPEGTEPLLLFSPVEGGRCIIPGMQDQPCSAITTPVYASYEGSPEVEVEVWVRFSGGNQWWNLGWSGNSYTQICSARFTGPQDGWSGMYGDMVAGVGRY